MATCRTTAGRAGVAAAGAAGPDEQQHTLQTRFKQQARTPGRGAVAADAFPAADNSATNAMRAIAERRKW